MQFLDKLIRRLLQLILTPFPQTPSTKSPKLQPMPNPIQQ